MTTRFLAASRRMLVILLAGAAVAAVPAASAQFNLPIPKVIDTERVLREDIQQTFAVRFGGNDRAKRLDSMSVIVPTAGTDTASYQRRARDFCRAERLDSLPCNSALSASAMRERMVRDSFHGTVFSERYIGTPLPLLYTSRASVTSYLRRSGLDEAVNFATQFGANVSEKEAYVSSNVVRGLVGRTIFSADYAAVVTRSSDQSAAKRDTLQNDKANILRAINNGGTIVGRFTVPMYAAAGGSAGLAAGLTAGAGFLGPISGTDSVKQSAIGSLTAEGVASIALRSLAGDYSKTADLIVGLRGGHAQSERPLTLQGSAKGITFGQLVIGIRQKNSMSLSALVTVAHRQFEDAFPRVMINYTATP